MLSWWPTVNVGKCVLSIYDGKGFLIKSRCFYWRQGKLKHKSIPFSLVNLNL